MARKAGSLATKPWWTPGRITAPGWIVRLIPPVIDQPDTSIAVVVEGLGKLSTKSVEAPASAGCISLITMFGAAGWLPGTRASLAKTVRRPWIALNNDVRWLAYVCGEDL